MLECPVSRVLLNTLFVQFSKKQKQKTNLQFICALVLHRVETLDLVIAVSLFASVGAISQNRSHPLGGFFRETLVGASAA